MRRTTLDHAVEADHGPRRFTVPKPGRGQVLLKSKASSLCGSDLHAIYRLPANKWSKDQEGYFEGIIGGHERT